MISRLIKKDTNDIYYCSNCRMRQPRVLENCFWCGNMFSNYEDVIIQDINNHAQALLDIDPETGKNKFAPNEIRGQRLKVSPIDDSSFISKEQIEQLMKVVNNEGNIH